MGAPDFNSMTRTDLTVWKIAIDAAIAAAKAAGGVTISTSRFWPTTRACRSPSPSSCRPLTERTDHVEPSPQG